MHRRSLSSVSPKDRAALAGLIQQYVTPAIVSQHLTTPDIHGGATFLSWHRNYLVGLENFLLAQGRPDFVPLPAWDPSEPIPSEFNIPDSGPGALQNLDPGITFSPQFDEENLGNWETEDDLGSALSGPHGSVHIAVGGVMANFQSPSAPIFWPWHSFVDDIWWSWQRLTVVTPDCTGRTLAEARRLLALVGLTTGTVTTNPHLHLSPIPEPPVPLPPLFPFQPFQPFRPFPVRRRRHAHTVVGQAPEPGDRVHHGVGVDLELGGFGPP